MSTSRSFKEHGFTDIVIIGDSGGNQKGMKQVSEQLNEEWEETVTRVHFVSDYYEKPFRQMNDSLIASGVSTDVHGFHAGVIDVSFLLAVDHKMIRQDLIANLANDSEENRKFGFREDPLKASIEIGKRMIDRMILVSLDQIAKLKIEN